MIVHADADAFFASVEQRDDPQLRGRPVAVCMDVVFAANYDSLTDLCDPCPPLQLALALHDDGLDTREGEQS